MSRPSTSPRRRQRQTEVLHWGSRIVILLISAAGLAIIAMIFLPEINRIQEWRATRDRLQAEVDAARAENEKRKTEVQLLQHDPEYFEIKARDTLDLMKPGETIVRPLPSATP